MVVFGGSAVAQTPVAAGEPGDGAFDHGPVLVVFGAPVIVLGGLAGSTLKGVVGADVQVFAAAAAGAAGL